RLQDEKLLHHQPFLREAAAPERAAEHCHRAEDRRVATSLHGRVSGAVLSGMEWGGLSAGVRIVVMTRRVMTIRLFALTCHRMRRCRTSLKNQSAPVAHNQPIT